jgi:glycosyltransferase involved in cell wall biosynthesis
MRVLFSLRSDASRVFGGDVLYAQQIARVLKELGHRVILSDRHPPGLQGIDLVNLINVVNTNEALRATQAATRKGIPTILTPEYYNLDRFFLHTHWKANVARLAFGEETALRLYRLRKKRTRPWRTLVSLMTTVDHVVAKSEREKRQLRSDFGLPPDKISVIPNGIDPRFGSGASPKRFIDQFGVKNFLLTVGRVEPIKNQLSLLRATRSINVPLVFIGGGFTASDAYFVECRREAWGRNVHFIDRLPHQELPHAFAAARAHIAPSYNETTSLVTLEAVLAGCPVVITKESPFEEYLGAGMLTCDPYDIDSIREAVTKVLRTPRSSLSMRTRLVKYFSWEKVGGELAAMYEQVV